MKLLLEFECTMNALVCNKYTYWILAALQRIVSSQFEISLTNNRDIVIGLGHDIEWPPCSPNLTPYDFFLCGYLKDKVFTSPTQDLSMRCGRKLSTGSLLYDRGLSFLQTRCAICTGEQHYGQSEMGVMLKEKALDDVHVCRSSV